ncbi:AAA family ATPase [Alienimonas chondri]|uniref:AAA family ATPase n=1 Tax=Alienimonas chondri TaxID=2681879 RepID=A0ABX1VH19_9PLAN|nr:ATP-binding protein [Alienimonas chondri]NNJ27389.1 hypothetical protein [Alienimonas chondri]
MQISELKIWNFKTIREISLAGLGEQVVIAGPNGCGKSTIFNAVRLVKAAYANDGSNGLQKWFSELGVASQRGVADVSAVLGDRTNPLRVEVAFALKPSETDAIANDAEKVCEALAWQSLFPQGEAVEDPGISIRPNHRRRFRSDVEDWVKEGLGRLRTQLRQREHLAWVELQPNGDSDVADSLLARIVFGDALPEDVGSIEYHPAERTYSREQVQSLNLQQLSADGSPRPHAVFDVANKYNSIKSHMLAGYLRSLIAACRDDSSVQDEATANLLIDSLKDLFQEFFEGKEFLGVRVATDGRFEFPVQMANGEEHDLDSLSSGEKEVLFGYLHLWNQRIRNSVILLDEPELHLHPKLSRHIARFYHDNLGKPLGNQLWMVTHSDRLLEQVVQDSQAAVFHMHLGDSGAEVVRVGADDQLQRAVLNLTGSLDGYKPKRPVLVLEGGGTVGAQEFDKRMVEALFPDFISEVNLISGGSKSAVRKMVEVLTVEALSGVTEKVSVAAIVDADGDGVESGEKIHCWPCYHIENFLLEPKFIHSAFLHFNADECFGVTVDVVEDIMVECAREMLPKVASHAVISKFESELQTASGLTVRGNIDNWQEMLARQLEAISGRLQSMIPSLTDAKIQEREVEERKRFEDSLEDGTYVSVFRGRDLLRCLTGKLNQFSRGGGVAYETLRNGIVSEMKRSGHRPQGMKECLQNALGHR